MDALGAIAQLVEHLNGIEGVSGSSPLSSIPWKLASHTRPWLINLTILFELTSKSRERYANPFKWWESIFK